MTRIRYIDWTPRAHTQALVVAADSIIREYFEMGYTLTLRQLYYQFVARAIIENSERSYKNLGNTITKARMAGLISWEAIEDRNREHNAFWYEEDILEPVRDLPNYIRFDRWARQDNYVEVWVEKEALGNVIAKACKPLLVPYMSAKGYLSASEMWRAGQRFVQKMREGKDCTLIHLGDHDPSGLDMTRDNIDRLETFTQSHGWVNVERIALNYDQVQEHEPPPNPAKITDSRAKKYIREYGGTSWELDALEPSILERLIKNQVELLIDWDSWEEVGEREREAERLLSNVYDRWDDIEPLISGRN